MRDNKALYFAAICFQFIGVLNVRAQSVKEFEGVITYSHYVTAIKSDYDIDRDINYIGKQSEYYYRSGNYKWLNQNAFMEMDMFRHKDTLEYLKVQATDTILCGRNNLPNEEVTDYKILKNADTVLGYICDVLVINANVNGSKWTRRYAYTNKFPVDPTLFTNYKWNSTNVLYAQMKALPLKIELIYPDRKITYKAIKVEKKKLPENLFDFAPGTKFKSLM